MYPGTIPGDGTPIGNWVLESVCNQHGCWVSQVLHKLNILRGLSVTLAIDDFGTGYSSLDYLSGDPESGVIAEAIIQIGHSLGLNVLAEGIGTKEEETQLQYLGCDGGQGFLYAKPLWTQECEEHLRLAERD